MALDTSGSQEVCGPVSWDGLAAWDLPAIQLEVLLVVVTQVTSGGPIIGMTSGGATVPKGGPLGDEWEMHVTPLVGGPSAFQAGPAHALAAVRITFAQRRPDRNHIEFWNENISFSL
jgi:hypothetical protein